MNPGIRVAVKITFLFQASPPNILYNLAEIYPAANPKQT